MAKGLKFTLGSTIDPLVIKEIDACRGEVPRSRVVERALKLYLEASKNLQGSRIGTPASHAEATTTTPLDTTTPAAESLTNMTTNRGRRIGDVDANDT